MSKSILFYFHSKKQLIEVPFISEGEYIQIEEGKSIVTTANFKPMTEGIEIHVHFEAVGDQTKLIFSCLHPTEAYCKQQEEMGFYKGWGAVLNNLETYLLE